MNIDWRLGVEYSNVTITKGTGLLFSWSGTVKHNLVEMMSESSISHCTHVGLAPTSGQVNRNCQEWFVHEERACSF